MKHVDVVSVVQNAVAQALGETYLTQGDGKIASIESFKLADVGKDVLDSGSVENYTKSLLTQLGRMEIESDIFKDKIGTLNVPSDIFKDKIGTLNVPSELWYGYMECVKYDIQDILNVVESGIGHIYSIEKVKSFKKGDMPFKEYKHIIINV